MYCPVIRNTKYTHPYVYYSIGRHHAFVRSSIMIMISWITSFKVQLRTNLDEESDNLGFKNVIVCFYVATFQHYLHMKKYLQFEQYSKACVSYHDFMNRLFLLTRKVLNKGFRVVKFNSYQIVPLKRFKHEINMSQMCKDTFKCSKPQFHPLFLECDII